MDKELRPLYLKRRMQLIKAAEDEYEASQLEQVCTNRETPANPSKLTNYLIVHCLFSPVTVHTFAEEELRLETSPKE